MADLQKWRLAVDEGRQVWSYEDEPKRAPSFAEKYFLGIDKDEDTKDEEALPSNNATERLHKAMRFYEKLQLDDGHWGNDYGGPMFLMPGLIITCYITGVELSEPKKFQMLRYLHEMQRPDGGWGLHIESPSTMFGTALTYVSLRLLGQPADAPAAIAGRQWIKDHGGAQGTPSWGKFWLAALGVYDWRGVPPIPPEFWLLPYWAPMHPGRWWCHCRMVYLPMGYIYGKKATFAGDALTRQLRSELYQTPSYDVVDWPSMGGCVCPLDLYTPHSRLVRLEHAVLRGYEAVHSTWLRDKACAEVMEQIRAEDINTKYINIGPVNKALNMLCVFYENGPDSAAFQSHVERLDDYLWVGRDGMKMQGYNGSQLWDTAFSLQALYAARWASPSGAHKATLEAAYHFLEISQVREEVATPERHYRHVSVGAWPFSSRDHGWPISDCTAEGLKAVLRLHELPEEAFSPAVRISDERLFDAVYVLLSLQNDDGGWATYELMRAGAWLEAINPSETFHGIMVDYPYVECTSACIQALALFRQQYPAHRPTRIAGAIRRGLDFIVRIQRPDGSWKGSWGVCFTYAIWFGVEALVASGHTLASSDALRRACAFLLSKQNEDGGWGESFDSCVNMEWASHPDGSQVVNTAWALMALKAACHPDALAQQRGVDQLHAAQLANGDWAQEGISGVFNANCAISYSGYKNIFPIWALGLFSSADE